jgi:thioredoxin-related protein
VQLLPHLAIEGVRRVIDERFVFVRVEYESDEGKLFRERYGVTGFPTLLVIDADGKLMVRLPTTYDPAVFRISLGEV